MTVPIIVLIILLAGIITLQLLAWKKGDIWFWVGTFILEVGGNLFFLIESVAFRAKKVAENAEAVVNAPHYGSYSLICLYLCLVFLTAIIVSIVLLIGKKKIQKEEGYRY